EAIHTPHLADRYLAIENANYIFKAVKDFQQEFVLKEDSFINRRANQVLKEATEFLRQISEIGLMKAMEKGMFADIKRSENEGKGLDGVFKKAAEYVNPFMDKMKVELGLE
ncbi:MAG: lysine 5,6-aminomutase subunit alpha, partial [Candidatus Cloacimonas sp.]|nr:lysine 5,6-aminomutase subunit alpha [Candidatus Cloacimonadota bacterium]